MRPLNFTVRRRHAERDSVGTLQNEIRKRTKLGKVPSFEALGMHARAEGFWWRLLTIVGGGRDALVVGRRGTREKWWGRGACDTWSAGASTSPLESAAKKSTGGEIDHAKSLDKDPSIDGVPNARAGAVQGGY